MENWQQTKWGEIATLEYGKSLRDYRDSDGEYPVYGTNGAIGWHSQFLYPNAGVIIGRKGAYRGVHYSRKPFFVIDTAFYLKPKPNVNLDLKWAYYQLLTQDINGMDSGSAIPSTSRNSFYNLPVSFPPIEEQKAIAKILSSLDNKIELNRQMNATLEAMARALFKAWFVDFEPVRANSENRPSQSASPEIAKLFPSEFENDLPKGWQNTTFGTVYEIFDSKRIPLSGKQREARKGSYPYYGAASIMDYIDNYLFDGIYLLLGEDGSVTQSDGTPVVQYAWGKFWVNNHAHVLQGKGKISTEHLKLAIQDQNIVAFVTGAVQPKLNQGNLARIPFIKPNDEVAEIFSQKIKPLFARVRQNINENKYLAEIRDSFLPRLISGKIRVGEAESLSVSF